MSVNFPLYKKTYMAKKSKYRDIILNLIPPHESGKGIPANGLVKEIKKREKKSINWYMVRSILTDLEKEGFVEKIEYGSVTLWRRIKKEE